MSYILHLPSKNKILYKRLLEENYKKKIYKPDNISIIIPITPNQVEDSYLIKQLKLSNCNYYNPISEDIIWKDYKKPPYIYEALKDINTEYVLILDGNDTVILKDLKDLIDDFNLYNKKAIYNAEIYTSKQFKNFRKCCCNGGGVFGKTNYLLDFYKRVTDRINKFPIKTLDEINNEQPFINYSMDNDIGIDEQEIIFKCFNYQFKGN